MSAPLFHRTTAESNFSAASMIGFAQAGVAASGHAAAILL
jgi:hypothetical protein